MQTATAYTQPSMFFPFRFSAAEREVFRADEDLKISEWAEKNIHVPRGAHVGRYRNELNPYGVDVMDTWQQPHVREVNVCAPPQAMKSMILRCLIGHNISTDPCEMLLVQPSRDDIREEMDDFIIPMVQESPSLAKHISDNPDDTSKFHVKFNNGAVLYTAWPRSASRLARKAIKRIYVDECDKYPDTVGDETDPFALIDKRKTTFRHTYKIYRSSTPTLETGPIWRFLNASNVIKHWLVYCPDCGVGHVMHRKNLRYPKDKTPAEILQGKLARYECPNCHSHWTDTKRNFATRCGEWVVVEGLNIPYPISVGYHLSGCAVMDISLSEIAAKEIKAEAGDVAAQIDLANGYDAEPYKPEISDRKENAILRLRDNRPAGVVPADADALEISIDTQDNGFWYRIRAWRYGLELTSWLIKSGYLDSRTSDDFTGLDSLIAAEYPDENGEPHRIMAGIIDSAGHRTAEVYAWCRRSGILAAKGAPGRKTQPVTVNRIDRFPGNGKAIPGGLALYHIDTHYHKDMLANKLLIDPTDPGAFLLHSGYTYDQIKALDRDPGQKLGHNLEDYARQMCAEGRDERGLWQCPPNKANHLWDCESNGLALVLWLGWQHAVSEREKPPPVQHTNQQSPPANNRPGWFNNR